MPAAINTLHILLTVLAFGISLGQVGRSRTGDRLAGVAHLGRVRAICRAHFSVGVDLCKCHSEPPVHRGESITSWPIFGRSSAGDRGVVGYS